jgi:hypothetical protein
MLRRTWRRSQSHRSHPKTEMSENAFFKSALCASFSQLAFWACDRCDRVTCDRIAARRLRGGSQELQVGINVSDDQDRRAFRLAEKKARRARLEAELGARQRALPEKRYGTILADPPWRFEPYSRVTGMDRAAENHYPTSPLAEIRALDVESIAAADCVLFLWATAPMLPHAIEVMEVWGFTYKTCAVWSKDRIGTGYWFRNKHEILLVGTRGHVRPPPWERSGRR